MRLANEIANINKPFVVTSPQKANGQKSKEQKKDKSARGKSLTERVADWGFSRQQQQQRLAQQQRRDAGEELSAVTQ